MARSKKDAFIFLLDVGPAVAAEVDQTGKSFLNKSVECIGRIIQRKIFAESKDELAIIAFGTPGTKNPMAFDCDKSDFQNIYIERNFSQPTWDLLDYVVSKRRKDTVEGDWLKALYASIDYFIRQVEENKKPFKSLTIAFFTDFSSPCTQDREMLKNIIENLQANVANVYFIGPKIAHDGKFEHGVTDTQKEVMAVAGKIIRSLGDSSMNITFDESEVQFASLPKKRKRPNPWHANLHISESLEIPVSGYIGVSKETIPSWKEEVADKPGVGVARERTHVKRDVEMTEVSEEEIITGYRYGTQVIPFSFEDEQAMAYNPGPRDFSLAGFADSASIQKNYCVGNNTMYFIARKDDKRAQALLSSLIHALSETDKVAIVRRVYNAGNRPRIGFLLPVIHLRIEYLVYTQLPYAEDVRNFVFPSLEGATKRLSDEQKDAVDSLISSMDLSDVNGEEAVRSVEILNPYIQYVYRVLSYRQLHPEEPLREFMEKAKMEAMSVIEQPNSVKEASKDIVKRVSEVFPTEVVVRRKRKVEELGIGQRDENASAEAQPGPSVLAQPRTQDLNISDILGNRISAVGTVTPVEDFQTLISQGEDIRLACIQLEDVIIRLIVEAPSVAEHHLLSKAMDCLVALRSYCCKADPDIYNIWAKRLKQAILEKKNFDLLDKIKKGTLGPITSDENPLSNVATEALADFYKVEEEIEESETDNVPAETENLLDEL